MNETVILQALLWGIPTGGIWAFGVIGLRRLSVIQNTNRAIFDLLDPAPFEVAQELGIELKPHPAVQRFLNSDQGLHEPAPATRTRAWTDEPDDGTQAAEDGKHRGIGEGL